MPPPISRATTFVLGDSQAAGLERSHELEDIRIEDASGRRISYFLNWLRSNPHALDGVTQVYLQMGGNDISARRSSAQIIADFQDVFAEVRRMAPDARIVVGTIPVRGRYFDALAETEPGAARRGRRALEEVNAWLLSGAAPIVPFDVNSVIADPSHPDRPRTRFAGDRVHLSRAGYTAVADAFEARFIPAASAAPTETATSTTGPALTPPSIGRCLVGRGTGSPGGRVALTFDDGPNPTHTPAVLDILRTNGLRATFFVTGANARLYPELIRRIVAEGHELGSHSLHHDDLARMTAAEINEDLDAVQAAVDAALGFHYELTQVRPPFGSDRGVVRSTLESRGECDVNWDVDSLDWRHRSDLDAIYREIFEGDFRIRRGRGGTILFHDIHPYAPRLLQRVIDRLRTDGYTFTTTGTFAEEATAGPNS